MGKGFIVGALLLAFAACAEAPDNGTSAPEAVLEAMRSDTAWIRHLDSLAQTAIGPGARCLDPVSHTFSYGGRTWVFNQDWGGVLEIPADYLVEDDTVQAELSFHGTHVFSPDSLVLLSFYAGLRTLDEERTLRMVLDGLVEDGFTVLGTEMQDGGVTIRARSAEGINYYGCLSPAGSDGVEYAVSVQYPDEKAEEAAGIVKTASRYPAGPSGNVFRGEAL